MILEVKTAKYSVVHELFSFFLCIILFLYIMSLGSIHF